MSLPTLTELYQTKKAEQMTKQQTSLLSAILDLHESLQNFNPQPNSSVLKSLELRVKDLQTENNALTAELNQLNQELDNTEALEQRVEELEREVAFHADRFKTLQEHYKNSTSYSKELQDKIVALELQAQNTKPKDYKSWEDAANSERLHHNQTKLQLQAAREAHANAELKLDRFQKLFREALGQ